MKNMFDAASRSTVASTLPITRPGKSLETSFESGRDLHVCSRFSGHVSIFMFKPIKGTTENIIVGEEFHYYTRPLFFN